jgi:hypothetical protein
VVAVALHLELVRVVLQKVRQRRQSIF